MTEMILMRVLPGLGRKSRKPYILSTSEKKFIWNLPSCILVHLGFHAPCNDDEWCYSPFSKTLNHKRHDMMEYESGLHHKFCSINKKLCPSDLVSHIKDNHNDLLNIGGRMYLKTLFGDAFGDGEFI